MSERPTPEHILHVKDAIFRQWEHLPPEHQASAALALFGKVLEGEYGDWLVSASQLLCQDRLEPVGRLLPISGLSRAHLAQANLSEEELAQLDEGDLRRIVRDMRDRYTNDVFWEELAYVASRVLDEKRR